MKVAQRSALLIVIAVAILVLSILVLIRTHHDLTLDFLGIVGVLAGIGIAVVAVP